MFMLTFINIFARLFQQSFNPICIPRLHHKIHQLPNLKWESLNFTGCWQITCLDIAYYVYMSCRFFHQCIPLHLLALPFVQCMCALRTMCNHSRPIYILNDWLVYTQTERVSARHYLIIPCHQYSMMEDAHQMVTQHAWSSFRLILGLVYTGICRLTLYNCSEKLTNSPSWCPTKWDYDMLTVCHYSPMNLQPAFLENKNSACK